MRLNLIVDERDINMCVLFCVFKHNQINIVKITWRYADKCVQYCSPECV